MKLVFQTPKVIFHHWWFCLKQNITVFTLARQLGLSVSLLFYYAYFN